MKEYLFFASLMAMTTHKMGKKSLESVGKLKHWRASREKKTKDKIGRGSGRVVVSLKGNGALKNKKLQFFSFIFDQK
jgi:hypothetical protein